MTNGQRLLDQLEVLRHLRLQRGITLLRILCSFPSLHLGIRRIGSKFNLRITIENCKLWLPKLKNPIFIGSVSFLVIAKFIAAAEF